MTSLPTSAADEVCRHLAYVGPPQSLEDLVLAPAHSLLRQSYAPRDMRAGGTVNADGFGLGWYPPGGGAPVRYRRTCPMWADEGLPGLARHTRSGSVLAAARSATVGMPVVETAAAPFTAGPWLFSHNGIVPGWPDTMEKPAARLPVRDLLTLDAPTDSALLWALVRSRLLAGEEPAHAMGAVVLEVAELDPRARLNLLLHDGVRIVATAWDHALSVLDTGDSVTVASEPWDDDPRWEPVPDHHLVVGTVGSEGSEVRMRRLDEMLLPPVPDQEGAR